MLLEQLEDRRLLAVIHWDGGPNGSGTDWHEPQNWVGDSLPEGTDDVSIGAVFSNTLINLTQDADIQSINSSASIGVNAGVFQIAQDSVIASVKLEGGAVDVSGTLTIADSFYWSTGTLSGAGQTVSEGTFTLAPIYNSYPRLAGHTLVNTGVARHITGYGLSRTDGALLINESTGVLELQTGGHLFYGGDLSLPFINKGVVRHTVPSRSTYILVPFDNTGTVEIDSGGLIFTGGGSSTGSFELNDSTTLTFEDEGFSMLPGSPVMGPGTLHVGGAGTLTAEDAINVSKIDVQGGTLNMPLDVTVPALEFNGGTVNVGTQLSVTDSFTWTSGTLTGTGQTVSEGAFTLAARYSSYPHLSGHTLINTGTASDTTYYGLSRTDGALLINESTGVLELQTGGHLFYGGDLTLPFINKGTLRHTASGTSTWITVPLENSGQIEITTGELLLTGGGSSSGSIALSESTTLTIRDAAFSLLSGATVSGSGTLQVTYGGTLTAEGAINVPAIVVYNGTLDVAQHLTVPNLEFTHGTIHVGAGMQITEHFTWNSGTLTGAGQTVTEGVFTLASSYNAYPRLAGHTLINTGTASDTTYYGLSRTDGALLINESTGVLELQTGGHLFYGGDLTLPFINKGTLRHTASGTSTWITVPFVNTGSVEIENGILSLTSTMSTDGSGRLAISPYGKLLVQGALLGNTTNSDQYASQGALELSGSSDSASPLLFEVMGQNLGGTTSGYIRNFAYGMVSLGTNTYVRLIDKADNAFGTGPEALYVDSLVVPAGAILDLNSLPIYARTMQITGAVVGGAVFAVPDGGVVPLNVPTGGTITTAGEVDEWSFFGRAGDAVSLFADPGDSNSPPPLTPTLDYIDVQVIDPSGNVIAVGSSVTAGETVSLLGVNLPSSGTYRIQVCAEDTHASATGNYVLTVYDASLKQRSLVLGQQATGHLDTAYSVDRWTFSSAAGQQIRLDVVGTSASTIYFKLRGPEGWVGFNQATDFEPITLPQTGEYHLEVHCVGAGSAGGAYAVLVYSMDENELVSGVPFDGVLTGKADAHLFKLEVAEANPLYVHLDDSTVTDRTEVYVQFGVPPTRRQYDYRHEEVASDHLVHVPLAVPGTWYVLVYGSSVPKPSDFTIRANSSPMILTDVTPDRYPVDETIAVTIAGSGFLPGTVAELVANDDAFVAQNIEINAFERATATFDLSAVAVGVYDLRVTLPNGYQDTLEQAFEVTSAGQAHLETRLILPRALGWHQVATLYVEYENTGTVAMPAPILTVQSADPDGGEKPNLTLQPLHLKNARWTPTRPDGCSPSVQIYASGNQMGWLLPGEKMRVPVYYAGMDRPWDRTDSIREFEIRVHEAGSDALIDWETVAAEIHPTWISEETWPVVLANLQTQIGSTWGDYVAMLAENATYLARLGREVTDVAQLFGFEMQQALGLTLLGRELRETGMGSESHFWLRLYPAPQAALLGSRPLLSQNETPPPASLTRGRSPCFSFLWGA